MDKHLDKLSKQARLAIAFLCAGIGTLIAWLTKVAVMQYSIQTGEPVAVPIYLIVIIALWYLSGLFWFLAADEKPKT